MCKKELIFITDFQANFFIIEQNRLRSLKLFRKTLISLWMAWSVLILDDVEVLADLDEGLHGPVDVLL